MKIWFFLVSLLVLLQGQVLNTQIAPFLKGNHFEGMTLLDQKELMFNKINGVKFSEISDVAYERKSQELYFVSDEKKLRNPKNYRSRNKSLESLAWHPKYGLLTASEWPLRQHKKKDQTIYALNGKKWHFKAEPESKSANDNFFQKTLLSHP